MKVYVIVGENLDLENVSARAVYSKLEDAEAHLRSKELMWFDGRAAIVEHELDAVQNLTRLALDEDELDALVPKSKSRLA